MPVKDLLARGVVARSRTVARSGSSADVIEHDRHQDVAKQADEIPPQRAAQLRPHSHHVRIGEQPVEQAGPAEMQDRHDAGAGGGGEQHRFGDAVGRRAPRRARQIEQCRDDRAAARQRDPPDIFGDRKPPGDRDVDAPDADAVDEQPRHRDDEHQQQGERDAEADPPPARRLRPQHAVADSSLSEREADPRLDDRRLARAGRSRRSSRLLAVSIARIGVADERASSWCAAGCSARRAARNRAGSPCGGRPRCRDRCGRRRRSPASGSSAGRR